MVVALSSEVSMRMRTPGWQRISKGEWILQQKARKADRSLGKSPAIGQECNHPKPQAPRPIVEGLTWNQIQAATRQDRKIVESAMVYLYGFTRQRWESFASEMIDREYAELVSRNCIVLRTSEQYRAKQSSRNKSS
jgi:hypothetical protein